MPTKLAILGLDPIQQDWLSAVNELVETGAIEVSGSAHRTLALARDIGDVYKVPAFDDLRLLLREAAPQVILMDRPENASAEFLAACFAQNIGILSVGPPVHTLSEALTLADALEPRTNLLMVVPMMARTPGFDHGTHPDVLPRPIRFISTEMGAFNHAAAKAAELLGNQHTIVRSMSVLAWDAVASLIDLLGPPETVFASIRGTVPAGDAFTDITGSAGIILRFSEDTGGVVATLSLSDRIPARRSILAVANAGSARIEDFLCEVRDGEGKLLDVTRYPTASPVEAATLALRSFIEQFSAPTSPHRGWVHRIDLIAAVMEAMLVSHRTGQPESPDKFLSLRR